MYNLRYNIHARENTLFFLNDFKVLEDNIIIIFCRFRTLNNKQHVEIGTRKNSICLITAESYNIDCCVGFSQSETRNHFLKAKHTITQNIILIKLEISSTATSSLI